MQWSFSCISVTLCFTDSIMSLSSFLSLLLIFFLVLTLIWTCERADLIRWYFHHDFIKLKISDFLINFNSESVFFNFFFQRFVIRFTDSSCFWFFSASLSLVLLSLHSCLLQSLYTNDDFLSRLFNTHLCFFKIFLHLLSFNQLALKW